MLKTNWIKLKASPVFWPALLALIALLYAIGFIIDRSEFQGWLYQTLAGYVETVGSYWPCLIFGFVVWQFFQIRKRLARETQDRFAHIRTISGQHMQALVTRRLQLVRQDPYGNYVTKSWVQEIDYFVDNTVYRQLVRNKRDATWFKENRINIRTVIYRCVESKLQKEREVGFSETMTPAQFEIHCAQVLQNCGWAARVTRQTGDQGVDIIAEKHGVRVAIQCKLYTQPVGNKAVQEIAAGRTHERASFGAVVSNQGYTEAAKQLASTNRILLLHHRDLATLAKRIIEWQSPP